MFLLFFSLVLFYVFIHKHKKIVAGKLIYSLINNPSYLLTTGDVQITLH